MMVQLQRRSEKNPPFSVLMSVYQKDDVQFFKTALLSVIQQSAVPNEIVIVMDGPVSQGIEEIVENCRKEYTNIVVVRLEKNSGLGIALQQGLLHCNNELVARMDSDDVARPLRFEIQLEYFLENPEIDICGGYISEFMTTPKESISERQVPLCDLEIKKFAKKRNPMNHMTVMFKKKAVLEAGNYQDWHYLEDYYLWLRMMLKQSAFGNVKEVLVDVRVNQDMYKRRGGYRYFLSQKKLFDLMYHEAMITKFERYKTLSQRFIGQVILPNGLREVLYKRALR